MWVLAAVLILAPSVAQAQVWWDFIESLSGPGPYKGGGAYWRLGCFDQGGVWIWHCWDDAAHRNLRQIAEVRWLQAETVDDRPVLIVDPTDKREVSLQKIDAIVSVRVSPHLDVGAGGGFMYWSADDPANPGDRLSVKRMTLIPASFTFTPLAPFTQLTGRSTRREQWLRLLRIRMEVTYIPFGFTGKDWGRPDITEDRYSTDGNWVLAGGLLLDFRGLANTLGLQ
jgi:hypothetical protein